MPDSDSTRLRQAAGGPYEQTRFQSLPPSRQQRSDLRLQHLGRAAAYVHSPPVEGIVAAAERRNRDLTTCLPKRDSSLPKLILCVDLDHPQGSVFFFFSYPPIL
jgi:hypothetical protein